MEQPSILVKILHSIPHVNYTFRRVNDTFNPDSDVYLEVSTIPNTQREKSMYDTIPSQIPSEKCEKDTFEGYLTEIEMVL